MVIANVYKECKMDFFDEIRRRCLIKKNNALVCGDLENYVKSDKLLKFLNSRICFIKIQQVTTFEILEYLDSDKNKFLEIYLKLVDFKSIFQKYIVKS